MAETDEANATVSTSLDALIEVVDKACDDLEAARGVIDTARVDIASRNTAVSREVIAAATRAVDHLRKADEALRDLVKDLADR